VIGIHPKYQQCLKKHNENDNIKLQQKLFKNSKRKNDN
jgi:hypothetical protein